MNLPKKTRDDVIKEIEHKESPPEEPKDVTEWIHHPKWTKEKKLEELALNIFYWAKSGYSKYVGLPEDSDQFTKKKLFEDMTEEELRSVAKGLYQDLRNIEGDAIAFVKILREEKMTGSEQYHTVMANSFGHAMNLKDQELTMTKSLPRKPTKMERSSVSIFNMVMDCDMDPIKISDYSDPDPELLEAVPAEFARWAPCFPLERTEDGRILMAVKYACDVAQDEFEKYTGYKAKHIIAKEEDILESIDRHYGSEITFNPNTSEEEEERALKNVEVELDHNKIKNTLFDD